MLNAVTYTIRPGASHDVLLVKVTLRFPNAVIALYVRPAPLGVMGGRGRAMSCKLVFTAVRVVTARGAPGTTAAFSDPRKVLGTVRNGASDVDVTAYVPWLVRVAAMAPCGRPRTYADTATSEASCVPVMPAVVAYDEVIHVVMVVPKYSVKGDADSSVKRLLVCLTMTVSGDTTAWLVAAARMAASSAAQKSAAA